MPLDIEVIPILIKNMVKFLEDVTNVKITEMYKDLINLTPLEQKAYIQRELKPYELDIDELIEKLIILHNLDKNKFKVEHLQKFRRFLNALIEAV